MDRAEAKARIEAAERELEAARKALEEAEKPLTWPELPDGSLFKFEHFPDEVLLKISGGYYHGKHMNVRGGFDARPHMHFSVRRGEPVLRVNLDGTPYKGDPRK